MSAFEVPPMSVSCASWSSRESGGGGGGAAADAAEGAWEVRDTKSKAAAKKEKRLAAQGRTGLKK